MQGVARSEVKIWVVRRDLLGRVSEGWEEIGDDSLAGTAIRTAIMGCWGDATRSANQFRQEVNAALKKHGDGHTRMVAR
jgi:hypothetical protein